MKKFIVAAAALSAFAASPAFAGSTHISLGFWAPTPAPVYAPAPVYYEPAPVVYYPAVQHVYYAPPRAYYGYGFNYRNHWGRPSYYGWNDRHEHWRDRDDDDDRGWRGHR